MIVTVRGCSSCPFLNRDCVVHDTRGTCTLEELIGRDIPTHGKDRHRLAACGGASLVPMRRTPVWCPMRTLSITVALAKR